MKMGFIHNQGKYEYWSVTAGALVRKNKAEGTQEVASGYTGEIIGIRDKDDNYNGKPTSQLHILMRDPETKTEIVMAGNLFYYTGATRTSVAVWARHLINTLVQNRGENTPASAILDITFWAFNDSTCCGVRRHGESEKLPQAGLTAADVAKFEQAVEFLKGKYPWPASGQELNEFSQYVPEPEYDQEPPPDEDKLPF